MSAASMVRGQMRGATYLLSVVFCCAELPGAAVVSGRVEITDNGGARRADGSNVVVWLHDGRESVPASTEPGKRVAKFGMTSRDKKFQPGLVVVPLGAEVEFPNLDPIYHNVFSVSGENRFDLGLYRSGKSKSVRFQAPGLVRVYCNIHSQMIGFIHVMASPYFAVTSVEGKFEIENVPPGRYELRYWEAKAGEKSQPIQIGGTDLTSLVLQIDARGYAPKPHLNKHGKAYTEPDDEERY